MEPEVLLAIVELRTSNHRSVPFVASPALPQTERQLVYSRLMIMSRKTEADWESFWASYSLESFDSWQNQVTDLKISEQAVAISNPRRATTSQLNHDPIFQHSAFALTRFSLNKGWFRWRPCNASQLSDGNKS